MVQSLETAMLRQRLRTERPKRPRRPKRVKPPKRPRAEEIRYEVMMNVLIRDLRRETKEALIRPLRPVIMEHRKELPGLLRQDAPFDDAETLVERLQRSIDELWNTDRLRQLVFAVGLGVASRNAKTIGAQLRSVLGITASFNLQDPFPVDDVELTRRFVRGNVALIKKVQAKYLGEVEDTVMRGLQQGLRHEAISKQIISRVGVAQSDAARIARDQVSKFNGQLTALRHQSAGIEKFVWVTARDEDVRKEHEALDGQVFSYNKPPSEGLPGEAINCFPGDVVVSGAGVVAVTRRLYRGELVEVTTQSGSLRCTPQSPSTHPKRLPSL